MRIYDNVKNMFDIFPKDNNVGILTYYYYYFD